MANEQVINGWILKLGLDLSDVVKGEKRVEGILLKLEKIENNIAKTRESSTKMALSNEKKITGEKKKQESIAVKRTRAQTSIQNIERRASLGGLSGEALEKVKRDSKALQAQLKEMNSAKDFAFLSRRVSKFSQLTNDSIKRGNAEIAARNRLLDTQARIQDRLETIRTRARVGGLNSDQRALIDARASGIQAGFAGANKDSLRALARETRFLNDETTKYIALARRQKEAMTALRFAQNGLANSLMNFARGFTSVYLVFETATAFYRVAKELDSLQAGLLAASGGAEQAAKDFEFILQISKQLGISLTAAANGYRQIGAAGRQIGFTVDQTREFFLAASEASRAFGLSAERTQLVYLAFSQILSKGKVSQEELRRQMGEQLPGVMSVAARAMNVTTSELEDMIKTGISAQEFMPKFSAELRKAAREGGALAAAMNSITAAEQRLATSLQKSVDTANKWGFRQGAVDLLNSMSALVTSLEPIIAAIGAFFGKMASSFSRFVKAGSLAVTVLTSIVRLLSKFGVLEVDKELNKMNQSLSLFERMSMRLEAIWLMVTGRIEAAVGILDLFTSKMSAIDLAKAAVGLESQGLKDFRRVYQNSVNAGVSQAGTPSTTQNSKTVQVNNTNNFYGTPEENKHMMENMFQNWMATE